MNQYRDLTPRPGNAQQFGFDSASKYRAGNENAGLMEYWNLLKRRKLPIFIGAVLGAIVAFVLLLFQQPVYMAATTLEVQGFNENFMGMGAVDPQANQATTMINTANINTELRIIESGSIRGPVVDRMRRESVPSLPPSGGKVGKLRGIFFRNSRQEDPLTAMRNGIGMAARTLKAKPITSTRIISITCDSTIPDIASSFVNAVAAEYIAQNAQERSIKYQKTAQWLDTQVEETKVKLAQAEDNLQAFTRQSGTAFGETKETLADSKLKVLQGDLASIQADLIARKQKYDQVKASSADSMPDIVDDAQFRVLETKLAGLRQDLSKLTDKYKGPYPKVQAIQEQIDQTLADMKKEKEAALKRIKDDYDAAVVHEQMLQKAFAAQSGAVTAQSGPEAQYNQLKRSVDLYTQTLNSMLGQENQIAIVSAVPASNVRIIDLANPPGLPYKPDATTFVIYGLGLGALAMMALVLGVDKISKWRNSSTFGMPGHSPGILNVPELGVIPSAAVDLLQQESGSRWKWNRRAIAARTSASEPKAIELEMSKRRRSFLAESFRLTLTSILLMSRRGVQPKIMVVTSPNPGEGKTTVVSNMAISIAETGRKVLLIDADLRRPQLHTIFDVENKTGFSDLIGEARGNGFEKRNVTVCETQVPGVCLVPSGGKDILNLSQIFHSVEIPVLLKKLSEQFDVILIDTPPMLQFSDARLMARFADGVILVVRSGVTGRESAVTAREQLAQDQIDVLGTILNDWDVPNSKRYPYYSHYTSFVEEQKDVARS